MIKSTKKNVQKALAKGYVWEVAPRGRISYFRHQVVVIRRCVDNFDESDKRMLMYRSKNLFFSREEARKVARHLNVKHHQAAERRLDKALEKYRNYLACRGFCCDVKPR